MVMGATAGPMQITHVELSIASPWTFFFEARRRVARRALDATAAAQAPL